MKIKNTIQIFLVFLIFILFSEHIFASSIVPSPSAGSGEDLKGYCEANYDENSALESINFKWYKDNILNISGNLLISESISVGGYHACGIRRTDNRIMCWGLNNFGQIGDGTSGTNRDSPTLVDDTSEYRAVYTGLFHTCGILLNGTVKCWGNERSGALGNGNTSGTILSPDFIDDDSAYLSLSAGSQTTCGIRMKDNRVLCWGDNTYGQLGFGNTSDEHATPTLINDSSEYLQIDSRGSSHTCGIRKSDKRVKCWGDNTYGQLGTGDTNERLNPTLTADTAAYLDITTGLDRYHSCGIRENNNIVRCWGYNYFGQLGRGYTSTSELTPGPISDFSGYIDVEAGGFHVCGILESNNRIKCWGRGSLGQLGNGDTQDQYTPGLTSDTEGYRFLKTGAYNSCGVMKNETRMRCWGANAQNTVGDGTTTNRNESVYTDDTASFIIDPNSKSEYLTAINPSSNTKMDDNWIFSCQISTNSSEHTWINSTSVYIGYQGPAFKIKLNSNIVGYITPLGDLIIKGNLTEYNNLVSQLQEEPDSFVIKNRAQSNITVAYINSEGNLYLRGNLYERTSQTPTTESLIFKNATGNIIGHFSNSGDLYLKGSITTNA